MAEDGRLPIGRRLPACRTEHGLVGQRGTLRPRGTRPAQTISAQFERRMSALLSYASQYGVVEEGAALFPDEKEIRERLGAIARFYGNQIGVKYGEPFVVKEAIRIDDIVAMPVKSI